MSSKQHKKSKKRRRSSVGGGEELAAAAPAPEAPAAPGSVDKEVKVQLQYHGNDGSGTADVVGPVLGVCRCRHPRPNHLSGHRTHPSTSRKPQNMAPSGRFCVFLCVFVVVCEVI